MTDSSEEEVININRKIKQPGRKRALEDLFEENEERYDISEDSIASVDYGDQNSLFFEIFGTGDEYRYVLEEKENKPVNEVVESMITSETIDIDGVYEYALSNIKMNPTSLRRIIELVGEGYSIHFALLHNEIDNVGIEDGYKVVDMFDRYKEFIALKEEIKKQHEDDELLQKLMTTRSIKRYMSYKKCSVKKLTPSRELLSAEEFCDNLRVREKLHEPEQSLQPLAYPDEEELIKRISLHPIFQDTVYMLYKEYGESDKEEGLKVYDNVISENITKFYQSDVLLANDLWNEYREKIVLRAVEKVTSEEFVAQIIKERKEEEMKRKVFIEVIDRIVNGSVGVKGSESYICGVTEDKKYLKAAMLDFEGNAVEFVTFKEGEVSQLVKFIERFNPYCVVVSGFTVSVKYVMKILAVWNPIFVENRMANMGMPDTHTFCSNIARFVQCPEIEYSNLVDQGIVYIQESLPKKTLVETIKRGILTAVAMVGIDINYLLNNKRREGLMSLVGMSETLRDNLLDFGHVSRLEELRKLCYDMVEYENITTYFRIFPSIFPEDSVEILDSTPVHPKNYNTARLLCAGACNHNELNEERPSASVEEAFANNKASLRNLVITNALENQDDTASVASIHKSLIYNNRPVYSGLPDHLVFKELTGSDENLVGRVMEGKVVKCGDNFYLLSLENVSATVYVRKSDSTSQELFLNQLVMVKIERLNDFLLSYTGSIVAQEQQRMKYSRFVTHPLFKDLNSNQAEEYLKTNSLSLVLRRSGRDSSPVMVLRVLDDVYVHMKIQESDKYYYKGHAYDDLDEFISRVAKKILINVRNIKGHRYYFDDERAVLEYLEQGGSYIKYGFYFSRKYPGKLCMLYRTSRNCKEYINVGEFLTYEGREFKDLDEFMRYRKSI